MLINKKNEWGMKLMWALIISLALPLLYKTIVVGWAETLLAVQRAESYAFWAVPILFALIITSYHWGTYEKASEFFREIWNDFLAK